MKCFHKLFLLVFILPLFSSAQTNYKPGYVVTLKGDTLRGYIDYREWNKTPTDIQFKKDAGAGNAETFSAKNAMAFAVTGLEYYERHYVSISQDQVDMSLLSHGVDTTTLSNTVFLRLLTKGKYISLYGYNDAIKQRFYVSEAGSSTPVELTYHVYYNPGNVVTISYTNRFRAQLQYIIQKDGINTDKLSSEIDQCKYSEDDLLRVVQNINGNSSQTAASQKVSGIRWFAGAALGYNSFEFSGESQLSNAPANKRVVPQLSGGVDILFNKNIQKLYLRAELSLNYVAYNLVGQNTETPYATTNVLAFNQFNILITPQVIYNIYNKKDLKVFIDVGVSANISTYNKYGFTTNYSDGLAPIVMYGYPKLENVWFSVPLKAGVEVNKKLQFYFCFIPAASMTQYADFSGDVTAYQVGVNYLFGAK